jgi:acyl carrier protein
MTDHRREIFEAIRIELSRMLGLDPTRVEEITNFSLDLDADSFDLIELASAVEEAFGIAISDEELIELETVGDVVDCVVAARAEPVLEAEANRILEAFDEPGGSERALALVEAYQALTGFAAEKRGEEAHDLTLGGFAAVASSLKYSDVGWKAWESSVSAIFAIAQTSERGIRQVEFARWMDAVDVPQARAKDLFERLDSDGDGVVRADQVLTSILEASAADLEQQWGNSVLALA